MRHRNIPVVISFSCRTLKGNPMLYECKNNVYIYMMYVRLCRILCTVNVHKKPMEKLSKSDFFCNWISKKLSRTKKLSKKSQNRFRITWNQRIDFHDLTKSKSQKTKTHKHTHKKKKKLKSKKQNKTRENKTNKVLWSFFFFRKQLYCLLHCYHLSYLLASQVHHVTTKFLYSIKIF